MCSRNYEETVVWFDLKCLCCDLRAWGKKTLCKVSQNLINQNLPRSSPLFGASMREAILDDFLLHPLICPDGEAASCPERGSRAAA